MDKDILEKVESVNVVLRHFYDTLHPYDLYAFYWIISVATLLFILIILLRKNLVASLLTFLFLFLFIFFVPPIAYLEIHKYLYGTKYKITYLKQMKFADVMIIQGELKNIGDENITECRLHTYILPPQDGFMKNLQFIYLIKPIKKGIFVVEKKINVGESVDFKLKINHFKYSKELNSSDIYIYRECYNTNIHLK